MNQTGKKGEDHAVQYLMRKGHKILARNYSTRYGEIDIVSQITDTLVFTEVKTRKNDKFARALEHVDTRKIDKLRKTALLYLQSSGWEGDVRFDIIELYPDNESGFTVIHTENAF